MLVSLAGWVWWAWGRVRGVRTIFVGLGRMAYVAAVCVASQSCSLGGWARLSADSIGLGWRMHTAAPAPQRRPS